MSRWISSRDAATDISLLYSRLGNGIPVTIERAFMKHTFQASFTSYTGIQRRYCFSFPDAGTKAKWAAVLPRYISSSVQVNEGRSKDLQSNIRRSAEVVAMRVLRDALTACNNSHAETPTVNNHRRQESVSAVYSLTQGKEEGDLGSLVPSTPAVPDTSRAGMELQTGKELVLLVRQNSLLPALLELIQSGALKAEEEKRMAPPLSRNGSRRVAGPGEGLGRKPSRRAGGLI